VPELDQPGRSGHKGPESDLRAQIQARITARRTAARTADKQQPGTADKHQPETAAEPAGSRQPPSGIGRLLRTAGFLLVVALVVIGVRSFVVASYYIPSASMETTLHGCEHCQPDMVLVDKLSYRFGHVARGDVVVFDRPPLAPPEDKELIKRVIGLPGETVSGHDGTVFIGNKALSESYLNPACKGTGDFPAVTVPAGRYFMMGDNRCNSLDSRVFGTVPGSSIVGRSFSVIWPVKHLRWL
jgi:signal peptidase I